MIYSCHFRPYMNTYISTALAKLGYSLTEQHLFDLLLDGDRNISKLAATLQTSRPSIYKSLQKMASDGLIDNHNSPKSLKQIVFLLKQKEIEPSKTSEKLNKHLEELELTPNHISFTYTKQSEIIDFYNDLLNRAREREMLYFGNLDHFIQLVGLDYHQSWIRNRVNKDISVRSLLLQTPQAEKINNLPGNYKREYKYLPNKTDISSSWITYHNTLALIDPINLCVVEINNHLISKSHKQWFELTWSLLG
jgi:predicted transcriptional regulator